MNDRHDYLALDWVRGEIQETLNQAQQVLERFVDDPQDVSQMRFCRVYLHQIVGTLQMVEFFGAALLAEEMEELAAALLEQRVSNPNDAQELLMRAILQLPSYLERVATNRRDLPVVVLPLLNDLRAARGSGLLSETALFTPDLTAAVGGGDVPASLADSERFGELARKLRKMFQVALLGVLRQDDVAQNLAYMDKVFSKLSQVSGSAPRAPVWELCGAFIDGMHHDQIQINPSVKQLFSQMDRLLRDIVNEGATSLATPAPTDLIKNMLFYIAKCDDLTVRISHVKTTYGLADALPSEQLVDQERHSMTGPDSGAMASVSRAISEELTIIKNGLEQLVHQGISDGHQLAPHAQHLKQVADTLSVLGMNEPRGLVEQQLTALNELMSSEAPVHRDQLLDVAGAMLQVDTALSNLGSLAQPWQGHAAAPHNSHLDDAMTAVLRECRVGLEDIKDGIVNYIASQWQRETLARIPQLMHTVRGGLTVLQQAQAAQVLGQCGVYIETRLAADATPPSWQDMDTLADAISSVELYLERINNQDPSNSALLATAAERLTALGIESPQVPPINNSPEMSVPPALAADDMPVEATAETDDALIDDDIIEIFAEETEEVLAALDEYFPQWANDTSDTAALTEFRRAFHTLKGSGRMVGAQTVGEVGWAIEHMLNRVMDNSIEPDAMMIALVREVRQQLPALISAFCQQQPDPIDVAPLIAAAETLSAGGQLDSVPVIEPSPQASPEDTLAAVSAAPEVLDKDDAATAADVEIDGDVGIDGEANTATDNAFDAEADDAAAQDPDAARPEQEPLDPVAAIDLDVFDDLPDFTSPPARDDALPSDSDQPVAAVEQIDPMLLEIFTSEAEKNLAIIGDWLNGLDMDFSEHPVDDDVHRALHTIKGSARMAGIHAMAELAEPAEALVKGLINTHRPATQHHVELLGKVYDMMALGLAMLDATQPHLPGSDEVIAALQAAIGERGQQSGADPHIMAVFLSEGMDLIMDAADLVEQWAQTPDDTAQLATLREELETLETSAETAQLQQIQVLSAALANCYRAIEQQQLVYTPDTIALIQEGHEALINMMDCLAAGQTVMAETLLVDSLNEAADARVAPPADSNAPAAVDTPQEGSAGKPPASDSASPESLLPGASPDSNRYAPSGAQQLGRAEEDSDEDILDIFMEESEELCEIIEGALTAWQDHPDNREVMAELTRAVHTLKGGARMAGLTRLGDLSHDFETFMLDFENRQAPPTKQEFATMLGWFDGITRFMASTRNAEPAPGPAKRATVEFEPSATPNEELADDQTPATRVVMPQEMVRVSAGVLEELVNLAGETSINRSRVEQEMTEFGFNVEEMGNTVQRLYEQLRRLEAETEVQIMSNYQQGLERGDFDEDFDPLEMDQYSELHQITKQLSESASDLMDLKNTLVDRSKDTETLLLQQSRINTELQEKLMGTRMVPFTRMVPRLRRMVRQVSSELGKEVFFDILNPEGELDRSLMERVIAPLEHLLRNAVDHGIESPEQRRAAGKSAVGSVTLALQREGGEVLIVMSDDGRGIDTQAVLNKARDKGLVDAHADLTDQEIHQFIFSAGFSTATEVTQISGRGVGMDVVSSEIKQMGGTVSLESDVGQGTRITIRLPFTLAMSRALMVRSGESGYAIPLNQIEGIVRVDPHRLDELFSTPEPVFEHAGQDYELHYLGFFVHDQPRPNLVGISSPLPVLLVRSTEHTVAVVVDSLEGSREVVVKAVGPQLASVAGISGATILGDGSVVIILDVHALVRAAQVRLAQMTTAQIIDQAPRPTSRSEPVVMVIDDSVTVRKVTGRALERHGYRVVTAKDGVDAIAKLEEVTPDLMLLDIEMPRMDGYEVATHVRHNERLLDVPIIMITSRTGEKHRERAFDIGVNYYMGKPFQESELLSTVQALLDAREELPS